MKKLLLVSTAIAGIAMMSSPASAAIKTDVGGFFRGYGVYADNNEPTGAANQLSQFQFLRDSQIFFTGETTLDNGLTVGAHAQLNLGGYVAPGGTMVDEEYAYFSGGWGRFNFGQEDGAAYLLQIAAPSADSNVDGLRTRIQGLNTANWSAGFPAAFALDYQQADFRQIDRLTYLTPKFSGFQAGVSYAPNNTNNSAPGSSLLGMPHNDVPLAGTNKDLWEASARWDGEFQGFGIGLGAGYSDTSVGNKKAGVAAVGTDGVKTWNAGATFAMSGFSLGGAYKQTNNGISSNGDTKTYDIGLGWDNGPYHVGGSYFNDKLDANVGAGGGSATVDRWAGGAGYTFGPGMTFRGAVAWGTYNPAVGASTNFTQGTLGTDIEF